MEKIGLKRSPEAKFKIKTAGMENQSIGGINYTLQYQKDCCEMYWAGPVVPAGLEVYGFRVVSAREGIIRLKGTKETLSYTRRGPKSGTGEHSYRVKKPNQN